MASQLRRTPLNVPDGYPAETTRGRGGARVELEECVVRWRRRCKRPAREFRGGEQVRPKTETGCHAFVDGQTVYTTPHIIRLIWHTLVKLK